MKHLLRWNKAILIKLLIHLILLGKLHAQYIISKLTHIIPCFIKTCVDIINIYNLIVWEYDSRCITVLTTDATEDKNDYFSNTGSTGHHLWYTPLT